MTLANLIRKRDTGNLANANSAKAANDEQAKGELLARLATLSLANPTQGQAEAVKVGAGDTAAIGLVTYPDGRTAEVHCTPSATMAEILESRQGATAELLEPVTPRTSAPMPVDDEKIIRAWLARIGETDPATIAEVISQCRQDADARGYFTGRAADELPKPDPQDDRRTCAQCANYQLRVCRIAKPEAGALVVATSGYRPDPVRLVRCEGYAPMASDSDQRTGAERWPGLIQKGGE